MTRARSVVACGIAALLVAACSSRSRAAGEGAGTAAGGFLSLGAGTSALSMAGATLASGEDLAAASWNVASLARLDALQFSMSHAPLPGGAAQEWLAAGGRVLGGGTRWGIETLFHREGDLDGRDAANNSTGVFTVTDFAFGGRVARSLGRFASAGLGAHWVHESIAGITGSGVSFDAGIRADAGPISFALAGRHLGGTMRYPGASYDLPAVIAAGVGWSDLTRGLRVNADFESPLAAYRSLRMGGEWLWHDRVALRAGYRAALAAPSDARMSGASFGLGTGVGAVWMDYSYLPEGDESGGEHRVGITFRPGLVAGARVDPPREARLAPVRSAAPRIEKAERPPIQSPQAETQATPTRPAASGAPPAAPARAPAPPPAPKPATQPSAATGPAQAPAQAPPQTTAPSSPAGGPPSAAAAAPAVPAMPIPRPAVVIVAPGETLAQIARRWNTSVAALMMTNDLVNDSVVAGQRLRLPPAR